VQLVPRPGPPVLRPGGAGSAGGPAGQCCMSALHGGRAPCMWEWFVGLDSSVAMCGWYLDRGRRACGRGSGLGLGPSRSVLRVCPAWRKCALRVRLGSRSHFVRHDCHYYLKLAAWSWRGLAESAAKHTNAFYFACCHTGILLAVTLQLEFVFPNLVLL